MTVYEATWPDGYRVQWRNLSWAEYRKLQPHWRSNRLENPMDLFMEVYGICLVEGPDTSVVPAGIAAWVGRQQLEHNPFGGKYEDMQRMSDLARTVVNSDYLLSTKAFVASTLHYKMAEIDQMDADEYFLRVAQAEVILGRPLEPIDPHPPERPAKRGK